MDYQPIGILGGTFDPIHLGHVHLANQVWRNCRLAKVIFIPCNQSPLRIKPIANNVERLAMLQLALAEFPQFNIDDYEIKSSQLSYTLHTLQKLRLEYPKTPLCLIMGIDAFAKFDSWYHWQEIINFVHIIVADRPNSPSIENQPILELINVHAIQSPSALQTKPQGYIYFTKINPLPISATQIRALIQKNNDASSLLHPRVWQYIREHNIYSEPL